MRLDPGFLHCNENGFRFINQSLKEEPLNINRTQYLYRLMGDKMEINRGIDHSKVHFSTDQLAQHDAEITVHPESDSRFDVHLGFLQYLHDYEIKFSIKDQLSEDLSFDPLQNLHVKIKEVKPSEDGVGHDLVIEFSAYKEKLVKEELILSDSSDSSKEITIVLNARVLGKGKGTPLLKAGIRCIGLEPEDDSEQSDWQGF